MTLAPTTAAERAAFLRAEIARHRDLYYKGNAPEITDPEFDLLVRELEELEFQNPELAAPDSPTQNVGDDRTDGFPKTVHTIPMLSLKNVYSKSEFFEWWHGVQKALGVPFQLLVSVKVDGAAMELVYQDGDLDIAITRGDGTQGDVVTENIKAIGNHKIPHRTRDVFAGVFEVRGEIYFPFWAFEEANKRRVEVDRKEPFANARNAASGTLKLQDPKEVANRGLCFVAHGLGACSPGLLRPSMSEVFKDLEDQGIPVIEHAVVDDPEAAWEWIEEFDKQRSSLTYPCDGVVLSVNTLSTRGKLGATGHSPRWAVAYKYPAEQATTTITSITVQIGRTGRATPVAELEPVKLAGTTVSRATLHNEDECLRLGVCEGSTVVIEKGGEIIPKVVKVVSGGKGVFWSMPVTCPVCGGELKRRIEDDGKKQTACHYCTNPDCQAKVIGWLLHWCSRDVMNIQEFGPAIAETLVCQCRVRTPAALYKLTPDMMVAAGIGEKTARKLMLEIAGSLNRPFSCTIDGLGIHGIGTSMSKELVKHFASIHDLVNATDERLLAVPDFGKKTLASFRAWLNDDYHQRHLENLIMANVRMERTPAETPATVSEGAMSHPFYGKTLVFTGTLSMTRSDAETLAEAKGAKCSGSVSKKTNLLIAGPNAGSKLGKAEKLGIEVIDEAEFMRRLNS